MSWGSYSKLKCNKCGNVYDIENSTLIMNCGGYDRCPVCKSDGTIISNSSILDAMLNEQKLFEKRRKRVNL